MPPSPVDTEAPDARRFGGPRASSCLAPSGGLEPPTRKRPSGDGGGRKAGKLSAFSQHWSPKVVARLKDNLLQRRRDGAIGVRP